MRPAGWLLMAVLLLLLLPPLLFGCTAPFPEQPGQAQAVERVWSRFGATVAPPVIEWREDHCAGGDTRSAVVYGGACYSGLYLRDDRALIAWRGSFDRSAFAHELMHAWQWARGIDDPGHTHAAVWERVAAVDEELAKLGQME